MNFPIRIFPRAFETKQGCQAKNLTTLLCLFSIYFFGENLVSVYFDETVYNSLDDPKFWVEWAKPDGLHFILDEEGNVKRTSGLIWSYWFENSDNRRIAYNDFRNGDFVSTVFLGLDHGWGHKLQIFETMSYFDGDWQDQRRYATKEEALEGHYEVLRQLKIRNCEERI